MNKSKLLLEIMKMTKRLFLLYFLLRSINVYGEGDFVLRLKKIGTSERYYYSSSNHSSLEMNTDNGQFVFIFPNYPSGQIQKISGEFQIHDGIIELHEKANFECLSGIKREMMDSLFNACFRYASDSVYCNNGYIHNKLRVTYNFKKNYKEERIINGGNFILPCDFYVYSINPNYICLKSDDQIVLRLYFHNSGVNIKERDFLKKGTVIKLPKSRHGVRFLECYELYLRTEAANEEQKMKIENK